MTTSQLHALIRADLDQIPNYVPGKRLEGALKLSSNEVNFAPLDAALAAIAEQSYNRYPDMAGTELRTALAAHLSKDLPADQALTIDNVAIGCGSSALCQQAIDATCHEGDEVVFPWRSFEAYPIFCQVSGATPVPVPLTSDQRCDLQAMAQAITDKTRLVFICNPNNPSGTTVSKTEFVEFMKAATNCVVVLDEAYFEFNQEKADFNATQFLSEYPNLLGMRTFSKAYGLAGLRVGYAFGAPELIAALNKVSLPFAVNQAAQAAAIASLAATEELQERADQVAAESARVVAELQKLGLPAIPTQSNFVWLPGQGELGTKLLEFKVLTRVFPEGLRITITDPQESERLLSAIKKVLAAN